MSEGAFKNDRASMGEIGWEWASDCQMSCMDWTSGSSIDKGSHWLSLNERASDAAGVSEHLGLCYCDHHACERSC